MVKFPLFLPAKIFAMDIFTLPPALLVLVIFVARIIDVGLGTVRIMFVNRNMKNSAALLGFVEVLVWISITAQVLAQSNSWLHYFSYAGGFAMGNYVGIWMEEQLRIGYQLFRVITHKECSALIESLKAENLKITFVDGQGGMGPVKIILTVIKRKQAPKLIHIIESFDPEAFYSIEDIKHVAEYKDMERMRFRRRFFLPRRSTRMSK